MPLFLIQLLVGVALNLAVTLAQQAFAPKPTTAEPRQSVRGMRGAATTGGTQPLTIVLGTYGVAGHLEYRNTWGNAGETPNAYLTDVLSLSDYPITAVSAAWVNSEPVTLAGTGHVSQGYPIPERNSGGADHLWREFFDGSQATASSFLVSAFGADAERPWQSDMVGESIAYATMTALVNDTLWTGWPAYMYGLQGARVFDPRESTGAGGDGSQAWGTLATYAFSDNPIVLIYNILRGIYDADGNFLWGGHATAYQLPYDVWAAAMDRCDELVDLAGGGTEKRYRAGIEIAVSERPSDVIKDLLIGCNGRLAYAQGRYFILVDVPEEADGAITEADLLADKETTADLFPDLDNVVNGATATYLEPAQAWEDKETAPLYRSDLEAEDDDRRLLAGLNLRTVFSGTQAQRILKATVEESRRFRREVVPLPPQFGVYRPLQVLAFTSAERGYDGKLFLIGSKTEDEWGNVLLSLQEIDPSDFAWDADVDEGPLSFAPLTPIRPPAQPMLGFAVSPYVFSGADGSPRRPGILLEYAGALPDIRAVLFEVREDFGDGNTVATGEITYDTVHPGAAQPIGGQWTLPDADYEVRTKFLPPDGSGRATEWSTWLGVTTPNVKLGSDDIDFGAILDDISVDLTWVSRAVRKAIDDFERLGTTIAEQDLANYTDRNALKRELRVKVDAIEASFTEIIEVALGPGGAIATALSSLYAAMGGNSAEVNVRWEAKAAPSGYSARYAVEAAADDGDFRTAAFGLDVPEVTTDPTRFWVVADQWVLASPDLSNTHIPFVFDTGTGQAILETVRFRYLRSIAESGGTPVVEIDGDTGFFSFGAV